MTLDEFATLAQGVQGFLTPLALLIAAAWAVYTFSALRQVARSRADQAKTEAEIQKFEREAKIGAVVEISIEATQHAQGDDPDKMYISAVVEIENRRSRSTRLQYSNDRRPFLVFPVNLEGDGSLTYGEPVAYPVPVSRTTPRLAGLCERGAARRSHSTFR